MPPLRGPMRSMAWGGLGFGIALLVIGLIVLAINQGWIKIEKFDFVTFCSLGLIVFGFLIIGGVLWARRMMRGGWRRWAEGWGDMWRPGPPPP